jgi:magnesium-transporting ATPase (P-type)
MLSGSTVKMGEGRMLVLCVGKHSRRGQFLALSRQRFSENIMKEKINKLMATTFNYLLAFSVLYFLTYISVAIFHEAMIHELKLLLKLKEWYHLEFGFIVLMVGAPQGLHLTLLASMICIKVRLWFAEGIWVDYSENMTKMASVTEICYDK